MRGKAIVWFGGSAFSVAIIYYCILTLTRFLYFLNTYTL
jgi:hypothetical protein